MRHGANLQESICSDVLYFGHDGFVARCPPTMPNTPGGLPTRVSEDLKLAALCLSCSLCSVLVFLYVVCFAFNLLS